MAEAHWYVVHTYSGYENKVKANIDKTIENRHLEDQILEVRVPMPVSYTHLERYTDSLRTISRLEELEVQVQPVNFASLSSDMREDLSLLTEEKNLELDWENTVVEEGLNLDTKILYRILENLIGNAVRFANRKIKVQFSYCQGLLTTTVSDDGPGFPQKVLNSKDSYAYMGSDDENHLGMGLAICRVLCRKHGGQLTLSNSDQGGAVIKFVLLS